MKLPLDGGCLCGAVRFHCARAPLAMYNCHCRGCQRLHRAPFVPLLVLAARDVGITGSLEPCLASVREDRHFRRLCCAHCKQPLVTVGADLADVLLLPALALDDPSGYAPVADIWMTDAQSWTCVDYHLPKVYKSSPLIDRDVV